MKLLALNSVKILRLGFDFHRQIFCFHSIISLRALNCSLLVLLFNHAISRAKDDAMGSKGSSFSHHDWMVVVGSKKFMLSLNLYEYC